MRTILAICFTFGAFVQANADPIMFEGVTNDIRNVSPSNPYTEAGFTFTPENFRSAIYHAPAGSTLLGSSSDFFGFGEGNVVEPPQR